jgi:hypothetical protein
MPNELQPGTRRGGDGRGLKPESSPSSQSGPTRPTLA